MDTHPAPQYLIRQATSTDMAWVAHIESRIQAAPWSIAIWELSLHTDAHFFVMSAADGHACDESGNPIMAFLCASILPPTADITNIGVHPHYQGRGLGQAMLSHLFSALPAEMIHEIHLEVRVSNHRAIHLYEKNGFVVSGHRKKYYDTADRQGKEDGLLMIKRRALQETANRSK